MSTSPGIAIIPVLFTMMHRAVLSERTTLAFAQSAAHDGLKYPDLLNRILALGMARGRSAGMGE